MRRRKWNEDGERRFRLLLLLILVLLLGLVNLINPEFYPTIYHLSRSGDLNGTIAYLRSFGIYAALISFFIDVVINLVGFLPSIFISTANGLIFGLFWGTVISWLGETVGVAISFWAMRVLFRTMAMHVIEKSDMLTKIDSYESWKAVAFARAIPYMPNGLVTALCSISSMTFEEHLIGSLIGKLPSTAMEVIVGHDMVHIGQHAARLTIVVIGITAAYLAVWWYNKKRTHSGESDKK